MVKGKIDVDTRRGHEKIVIKKHSHTHTPDNADFLAGQHLEGKATKHLGKLGAVPSVQITELK